MKKTIFHGSGVAVVTPMFADGSIHYEELKRLIHWQIENSTDAIIVCGTTGESSIMTDEEHVNCIRVAVEATNGRVPVIAGAGSNDTAYAIWLSQQAKQLGADGLLHVTPYYNKTSQKGLVAHFNKIADATDLPIILYSVPSRTGLSIQPQTYLELAAHPNIVATKEASSDIALLSRIVATCGDRLDIYSGNDDQITPFLSMGAKGVISVLANVVPQRVHDMCQSFFDGDVATSRRLQVESMALVDALFSDVNPIPVKAAANLLGFDTGICRLPLIGADDACITRLKAAMQSLGLL